MASVEAIAGSDLFRIDSFFDVFVDLTLDGPTPLHATRSAHLALLPAAVPEPASLTLLAGAVLCCPPCDAAAARTEASRPASISGTLVAL